MDSTFISIQKEKLIVKREELIKEINRLKGEDSYLEEYKEPGGRLADEEDDVVEDSQHSNMQSILSQLKKELDQVLKALKAIDLGTYGIDEVTGENIDQARLVAYPEATTK